MDYLQVRPLSSCSMNGFNQQLIHQIPMSRTLPSDRMPHASQQATLLVCDTSLHSAQCTMKQEQDADQLMPTNSAPNGVATHVTELQHTRLLLLLLLLLPLLGFNPYQTFTACLGASSSVSRAAGACSEQQHLITTTSKHFNPHLCSCVHQVDGTAMWHIKRCSECTEELTFGTGGWQRNLLLQFMVQTSLSGRSQ